MESESSGTDDLEATSSLAVRDLAWAGDVLHAASAAQIGCQVRRLRIAAGISQHELACRSATSQPAIAHLEAGRRIPTLRTLEKLAGALGFELVVVLSSQDKSAQSVEPSIDEQGTSIAPTEVSA